MVQHIFQSNPALLLGRAPLAESDQAGKAAIGGAVPRQAKKTRAGMLVRLLEVRRKIKTRAGDQTNGAFPHSFIFLRGDVLPRSNMGTYHTGQAVAVGQRHRHVAKLRRPLDQFLGVRGAAQKTVIARYLQFGISVHMRQPNRPCSHQPGVMPRR